MSKFSQFIVIMNWRWFRIYTFTDFICLVIYFLIPYLCFFVFLLSMWHLVESVLRIILPKINIFYVIPLKFKIKIYLILQDHIINCEFWDYCIWFSKFFLFLIKRHLSRCISDVRLLCAFWDSGAFSYFVHLPLVS